MSRCIEEGRIIWPASPNGRPRYRRYLSDLDDDYTGLSSIVETSFSTQATRSLKLAFEGKDVFDFPKPTEYIQSLIQQSTISDNNDIVLDFFAGSGTTAQAVMELNKEDGGNRKFILVQLPEPTGNREYATIADITRERVRRAATKLNAADAGTLPLADAPTPDRGFKAFTLDESNFKVWNGDAADGDALAAQLLLYAEHRLSDRSARDVLYELLLKSGRSLTAPIVERAVAGGTVYDVDGGQLLICLDDPITEETLRGIIAAKPERVLCLDAAFEGNDQLKTNIVLQMRDAEIEFRTV